MKYAVAGLGILLAGMLTFMGIYFVLDGTIVNEENYHDLKEAMAGAMYDSVDIDYFQQTGEVKIIKEKFVETFTRRFIDSTSYGKKTYTIEFYDIIESPPKASVIIKSKGGEVVLSLDSDELSSYDIINRLDATLLYNTKHLYTYDLYAIGDITTNTMPGIKSYQIKIPEELKRVYNLTEEDVYTSGNKDNTSADREKCKIVNIEYVDAIKAEQFNSAGENSVKEQFINNYRTWYYDTADYAQANLSKQFCEIEIISKFKFNRDNGKYQENGLDNIQINLKNESCTGISGYKMRVTWQCMQ